MEFTRDYVFNFHHSLIKDYDKDHQGGESVFIESIKSNKLISPARSKIQPIKAGNLQTPYGSALYISASNASACNIPPVFLAQTSSASTSGFGSIAFLASSTSGQSQSDPLIGHIPLTSRPSGPPGYRPFRHQNSSNVNTNVSYSLSSNSLPTIPSVPVGMGMSNPGYLPVTTADASMHPGLTPIHPPTSLPGYHPGALPGAHAGAHMHPIPPGPSPATSLPGYLPGALPGIHSGAHVHPIQPGHNLATSLPGYSPGVLPGAHAGAHIHPIQPGSNPAPCLPGYASGNSSTFLGDKMHPALHPVSKPGVLYPITTATVPVSSQSYPLTSIVTPGYPGMSMHPWCIRVFLMHQVVVFLHTLSLHPFLCLLLILWGGLALPMRLWLCIRSARMHRVFVLGSGRFLVGTYSCTSPLRVSFA